MMGDIKKDINTLKDIVVNSRIRFFKFKYSVKRIVV